MAASLEALAHHIDVLTGLQVGSALATDTLLTFGLAGALISAGVAVIALLPWTDQQLKATELEARQVRHRLAAVAVRVRTPVAVQLTRPS